MRISRNSIAQLVLGITVIIILGPSFGFGYAYQVLVMACSLFILGFIFGIRFRLNVLVVFIVFIFLSVIQSLSLEDYWQLRDFSRLTVLLLLFVNFPHKNGENQKLFNAISFAISFLIFFDFIFLYLFNLGFQKYFVMPGMVDYIDGFWRHIGIMGNPNVSGLLYSFAFLVFMENVINSKVKDFRTLYSVVVMSISIFLLIFSYSRTSFVSLFFVLFIFSSLKEKIIYICFSIVLFFLVFLFNPELMYTLEMRTTSFSSFMSRIELWSNTFVINDTNALLFGRPLILSLTDNDYLFYFLRFGVTGVVIVLFFILYSFFLSVKFHENKVYAKIITFSLVSSIAGGALAVPALTFIIILIYLLSFTATASCSKISFTK